MTGSGTIDELLLRWQELRRHGTPPLVHELCADHPSLADELARRIAAFESMEALLGVGEGATAPDPGGHAVSPHLAEKLLAQGYQLLEVIDHGGMGVVYKATQVELRRTVAVKMLSGFAATPKRLARFRVEVEAIARLHHPHIVQIHEVGEVDGHSFFSMEYVEGGNLARRLAGGPLAPREAAGLVETIARAVHHAHSRGIVHRDLKPANILLGNAECGVRNAESEAVGPGLDSAFRTPHSALVPKVSDFGVAKLVGADVDHTATGEVIGTPSYMSPEQAEGKTDLVGPPCDVYALGAILYECLTGRPPFRANTVLETLRQVIADEPRPPRRTQTGIPRDLEAICLKCLEKRAARRYPSAEDLADDLRKFLDGRPVTARPLTVFGRAVKWTRRHPVWTSVLLLVALAPGTVAGWDSYQREQERRRVIRRAIEVAPQAREILHRHCFECHGEPRNKVERGFFVLDRASLLDPNRKNVIPGHPDISRLIYRIEDGTMPPEKEEQWLPRVSDLELSILKDWIAGGAPEFPPEDPGHPTPPVVRYDPLAAEVKEIFIQRCYECHNYKPEKPEGGIKILDHPLLVDKRRVVIPGRPDDSELYQLIVNEDEGQLMMPPKEYPRMPPEEIATIRRWIEIGAPPFPRTPKGK